MKNYKSSLGKKITKKNRVPLLLSDKAIRDSFNKSVNTSGVMFSNYKRHFVSRLFWGRSNTYKNLSHLFMFLATFIIAISGIVFKVNEINAETKTIQSNSSVAGTFDLMQQGGSISTVLVQDDTNLNLKTIKYTVKKDDTLQSISKEYGVSVDTIRWASKDVVSPFTDNIETGWVLTIPEINGVLYSVKSGQTLDQVIAETSVNNNEANRFNIIEFNALEPPYTLEEGQQIFIPDGNLRQVTATGSVSEIPRGVFSNPLSHPNCAGYNYSRGFTWYHNGVDLARGGGCPIRALANGQVEYAGWASQGQGYMVRIDHGGGIKTEYFHGNGVYWVKVGDSVSQNQEIMHMGSTGFSTGTHLHLILWKDGVAVDPAPYVPY